jgi:hypothetical protein
MNHEINPRILNKAVRNTEREKRLQERRENNERNKLINFQSAVENGLKQKYLDIAIEKLKDSSTSEIILEAQTAQKEDMDKEAMLAAGIGLKQIEEAMAEERAKKKNRKDLIDQVIEVMVGLLLLMIYGLGFIYIVVPLLEWLTGIPFLWRF